MDNTARATPGQRIGLLLRGPGILALLIAGAAILTAAHGHQPGHAVTRPPVTATPAPYMLAVLQAHSIRDPATAMKVRVVATRLAGPTQRRLVLSVKVTITNGGRLHRDYGAINLYALSGAGQTYGSVRPPPGLPPLTSGSLPPGARYSGWVAFSLPPRTEQLSLLWNDNNTLLPPGIPAHILIAPTAGSG